MSNGYVASIRRGIGPEKLSKVLSAFPGLSRDWLLYGEGPMYRDGPEQPPSMQQTAAPGATQVQASRSTVTVEPPSALAAAMARLQELSAALARQQELTAEAQRQNARLISLFEKLTLK